MSCSLITPSHCAFPFGFRTGAVSPVGEILCPGGAVSDRADAVALQFFRGNFPAGKGEDIDDAFHSFVRGLDGRHGPGGPIERVGSRGGGEEKEEGEQLERRLGFHRLDLCPSCCGGLMRRTENESAFNALPRGAVGRKTQRVSVGAANQQSKTTPGRCMPRRATCSSAYSPCSMGLLLATPMTAVALILVQNSISKMCSETPKEPCLTTAIGCVPTVLRADRKFCKRADRFPW